MLQVRLFSALIKDIEQAPPAHAWGGRSSLGALIAEFPAPGSSLGGWVHAVSFSADGNRVAWVAHDSSITVADPKRPVMRLKTQFLPFRAITWVAPDKVVAAGHDCSPYLYKVSPEGQLILVCKLDVYKKREAAGLRYFFLEIFGCGQLLTKYLFYFPVQCASSSPLIEMLALSQPTPRWTRCTRMPSLAFASTVVAKMRVKLSAPLGWMANWSFGT